MKKTIICLAASLCLNAQAQQINPMLFGQSFHHTNFGAVTSNYPTPHTGYEPLDPAAWTSVQESGVRLMRVGGKSYNIGTAKPPGDRLFYYVAMVDEIRRNNCEPVITLPFTFPSAASPQPNTGDVAGVFQLAVNNSKKNAIAILTTLNKVHKRNIKYIILGNEPGLDYGWYQLGYTPQADEQVAKNIAAYTKPMAQAIKEFDPSIRIIGPEFEYFRYGVLSRASQKNDHCEIS